MAVATLDAVKLMKMLVDQEMEIYHDLDLKVVFLQNIIVDLMLGYDVAEPFVAYCQPAATLDPAPAATAARPAPYYLRMRLHDKPGALAKIATALGSAGISINRMRQYGHAEPTAPVLIVTHKTTSDALDDAITAMQDTDVMVGHPVALRIENV